MAKTYNEHSYSGEQMMEPMIKPHIQNKALEDFGIIVETTQDSSYEFTSVRTGDEYIYGYSDGFQGGNSAKYTDKGFKLVEFKKETKFSKQDYKNRIQRRQIRAGVNSNEISGTAAEQVEIAMHMQGVASGVWKSFWLGDTAKVHTYAGEYIKGDTNSAFAVGDADIRYNKTDGIWKEIMTRQSADNIPRVTLDYTSDNALINVTGGIALKDDAAKEIFKQVYNNASDALKEMYDAGLAQFFITRLVEQNYMDSAESGTSDAAFKTMINGIEKRAYRDIPLVNMRIQGSILKDFANEMRFRVCLTTPDNFGMVLGLGDFASARYWFNEDENQHRQRTQFEMEHGFIDPELLSVAY